MVEYMAKAAGFGFAAGTSFGPFQTILMNTTLTFGWRQGLLMTLAPLITDAPIILLMLFILKQLPPDAIRVIQILGGLAVLYIAYSTWKQAQSLNGNEKVKIDQENVSRQTLLKGIAVNFLNPGPYIFWGTITGPILLQALEQSILHGAAYLFGFYGTFLGILAIFVLICDRLRGIDIKYIRLMTQFAVLVLIVLGLQMLYQGLFPSI